MDIEEIPEKVSQGVGGLRDRAAEVIAGDGESIFRAIKRVAERIEEVESSLEDRIDEAEKSLSSGIGELKTQKRRTSWPRRLFWLTVGASAVVSFVVSAPDKADELRKQISG